MLLAITFMALGFLIIIVAADQLVKSAAYIAMRHHISPVLIGLTIVALGTSAPEIVVSIMAALEGKSGLSIGNAVGSNIANIGLVLGLTTLLKPIEIHSETIYRELPILFIIMTAAYLLLIDGFFSVYDGILLLLGLGGLIVFLFAIAQKNRHDAINEEVTEHIDKHCSFPYLRLITGLAMLPISAKIIVDSGIIIAAMLGVSETVVGLSVIALGTSLPEVATSLVGVYRNENDLAIGNILGSNMFNLLAVLPFAGLLSPSHVPILINQRDMPLMFGLSFFIAAIAFLSKKGLGRVSGLILLLIYIGYLALLSFGFGGL